MYTKSEILYNRVTTKFKIYGSHALFLIELHIQNPLNKIVLNEILKEKYTFAKRFFFLHNSVQFTYLSLKREKFGSINDLMHFWLSISEKKAKLL